MGSDFGSIASATVPEIHPPPGHSGLRRRNRCVQRGRGGAGISGTADEAIEPKSDE